MSLRLRRHCKDAATGGGVAAAEFSGVLPRLCAAVVRAGVAAEATLAET